MVGESRTELLHWLNTELQLNYKKIEQCGSGAAYCQLMDSIYGGVAMNKVKFNTNLEYDYRSNMKILQVAFNKHNITKTIEVEKLVKCRLQDNLELLQFIRRIWLENKDVHSEYDAGARRSSTGTNFVGSSGPGLGSGPSSGSYSGPGSGSSGANAPRSRVSSAGAPTGSLGSSGSIGSANRTNSRQQTSRPVSRAASGSGSSPIVRHLPKQRKSAIESAYNGSANAAPTTPNSAFGGSQANPQAVQELALVKRQLEQANEEISEYNILVESMRTERNFYFNKLIEIETLIRNVTADENKEILASLTISEFASQVQEILYSVEEGFQVADEMEGIDEETF